MIDTLDILERGIELSRRAAHTLWPLRFPVPRHLQPQAEHSDHVDGVGYIPTAIVVIR